VKGEIRRSLTVNGDSWIAARASSDVRDSYFHPVYAHTSPVYVNTGLPGAARTSAARGFLDRLDGSLEWIRGEGRYEKRKHQQEVIDLFQRARKIYEQLAR